jgi:hypothetical protein
MAVGDRLQEGAFKMEDEGMWQDARVIRMIAFPRRKHRGLAGRKAPFFQRINLKPAYNHPHTFNKSKCHSSSNNLLLPNSTSSNFRHKKARHCLAS